MRFLTMLAQRQKTTSKKFRCDVVSEVLDDANLTSHERRDIFLPLLYQLPFVPAFPVLNPPAVSSSIYYCSSIQECPRPTRFARPTRQTNSGKRSIPVLNIENVRAPSGPCCDTENTVRKRGKVSIAYTQPLNFATLRPFSGCRSLSAQHTRREGKQNGQDRVSTERPTTLSITRRLGISPSSKDMATYMRIAAIRSEVTNQRNGM